MKKGKFLTDLYKKIDNKSYNVKEAVDFFVESKRDKFDETIEVSMNLGIDPRHADQMVRGVVSLPNGNGKQMKVAVFAKDQKAEEAKKAGADVVGAEDLAELFIAAVPTTAATLCQRSVRVSRPRRCPRMALEYRSVRLRPRYCRAAASFAC